MTGFMETSTLSFWRTNRRTGTNLQDHQSDKITSLLSPDTRSESSPEKWQKRPFIIFQKQLIPRNFLDFVLHLLIGYVSMGRGLPYRKVTKNSILQDFGNRLKNPLKNVCHILKSLVLLSEQWLSELSQNENVSVGIFEK